MAITIIAVNQTASPLTVNTLSIPDQQIPASGSVTLTDFAEPQEVYENPEIMGYITSDDLLLNDGVMLLTKQESLDFITSSNLFSDIENAGATGLVGITGLVGVTGIMGVDGDTGITGSTGISGLGETGLVGTTGLQGTAGRAANTANYDFSTTTTDADPGSGNFRLNNATQDSATQAYIDNVDVSGNNLGNYWLAVALNGATITISQVNDPTRFKVFSIDADAVQSGGSGGYIRLTSIALIDGGSDLQDTEECFLSIGLAGNQGATGLSGVSGETGITGSTGAGIQGITGLSGDTGILGNQGDTGLFGLTGIFGLTGLYGETGIQGLTGSQGITGLYGQTGLVGLGVFASGRVTGTTGAVANAVNLSVNRTGTGTYTVTFLSPAPNANYSVATQVYNAVTDTNIFVSNTTVNGFDVLTGVGDNGTSPDVPTDTDHTVAVFGFGGLGVQGSTGVAGATGLVFQGQTGIRGTTGIQGLTGIQGVTGIGDDLLNNYGATTDPTTTDDSAAGYQVGSRWINTSTGTLWTCVDNTVSAAIWAASGTLINISVGRNNANATNEWLRDANGTPTNTAPIRFPFPMRIIAISGTGNASQSWDAEIFDGAIARVGGTPADASKLTELVVTSANSADVTGLNVALTAGQEIGVFMRGTSIDFPRVNIWLERTI